MPKIRQCPTEVDIEFMRFLEDEFKTQTGLKDRSQFKIFYGPVWRAPIVLLGINPGGDPATIAPDGVRYLDGRNGRAASSTGYYENGENDLVDCAWHENTGLLKLLSPILGSADDIRRNAVKTNLAFVRLKNTKNNRPIERSKDESASFLRRILDRVLPDLILLTGVRMHDFGDRHCAEVVTLSERQVERSVNQTVFSAARIRLLGGHSCIAVEVAHASQFNWIYDRYAVALKIKTLLDDQNSRPHEPAGNVSTTFTSTSSGFPRLSARSVSILPPEQEGAPTTDMVVAACNARTEAMSGTQMRDIGPEDTKPILKELLCLGLDPDNYKTHLHHAHHSASKMLGYHASKYHHRSPNLLLHRKLEWILHVCKERKMQSGRPDNRGEIREIAIKTTKEGWRPD